MGTVRNVVTFNHILIREQPAILTDTTSLDGLEKGVAILVLLLNELGVVIEFVKGCRNGQ